MVAFLIECKFPRNALHRKKKQTLLLAGYKHATIDRLTWVIIQFIKDASEILLIYSLTINGNWTETKVND